MNYFVILGIILFLYMNVWFVVSLIEKRNDVADVAWGIGFALLAWSSFFLTEASSTLSFVVTLLVTLWGLRLSLHVYSRNKDKPEDDRYQKWREEWGKYVYIRSYFQVYLLQGALLFLIVLPVLIINMNPSGTWHIFSTLGVIVWIGGFFVEVVGDWQLAQFLKDPENKGKLMTHGLWRYTRHPNYFGEVTLWWGIWIMALSVPYGWATVIGPITITVLILKVSGVPMLEEKMADHPDFAEYKKKTSMFIPWFRKSD